ncbi:MAG: hypothetical protein IJI21_04240 [Clostridia bacterium]|nr:hypothetical protein [Clostridia bacterium]
MLAEELVQNPRATYEPVCFVDVDEGKVGREVYGVPVIASDNDLSSEMEKRGVQEVVFALPNVDSTRRQELYEIYKGLGYKIKSYDYPTLGESGRRVLSLFQNGRFDGDGFIVHDASSSVVTSDCDVWINGDVRMCWP